MPYSINTLAKVLGEIREVGIDFVVIGDTVVYLETKNRELEGDVDLFVTNISPFVEEENIRSIAEEHGWGFGYTDLGTPRLIVRTSEGDVVVELYENIHDFYIPEEMVQEAKKIRIRNVEVNIIHVEDYIILKARAGGPEDLEKLSKMLKFIKSKGYCLNQRILRRHILFFEPDEQQLIRSRLEGLGVRL